MNLYKFLESIDNDTLFIYIIITLISLFVFLKYDITLNIIFALFIAVIIIIYLNDKKVTASEAEQEDTKVKSDAIIPKSEIIDQNDKLLDFIFSIQDFYAYNPPAYEEFIANIESILKLQKDINTGVRNCAQYYTVMEMKVRNALNALSSILYMLPNDPYVTNKFNRAHKRLNTLLTELLNEVYAICNNDLINNGFNVNTLLIHTGPKEYNIYSKNDGSYEFY